MDIVLLKKATPGLGPWNEGERLQRPHGLCCVGDHLYICDTDNHFLRRANASFLDTLENVAGIGRSVWGKTEGDALTVPVTSPFGVFPGPSGTLYITSAWEATLLEYKDGRLAVRIGFSGSGCEDGPMSTATLENPTGGCVCSQTGDIFLADSENCRIRRINRANIVTSIGTGHASPGDGSFASCSFNEPFAICEGKRNTFYVSEYSTIRTLDTTEGKVTTLCGRDVSGYLDGSLKVAKFLELKGIVYCRSILYVADFGNGRIRCVDIKHGRVTTLAGPFEAGVNGASSGKGAPFGLALSPRGDLIFSQPKLNQISIIRNVVNPIDLPETQHENIKLGIPLEFCRIEVKSLTKFPRNMGSYSLENGSHGAGHSTSPTIDDGVASLLSKLNPAFLDLVSPSLANYLDRFYSLLVTYDIPIDDVVDFFHSEKIPPTWTDQTILNMLYITKHCHVAQQYRESLCRIWITELPKIELPQLVDLLAHVENHCKGNSKWSSFIAKLAANRLKTVIPGEVPEGVSSFVRDCILNECSNPSNNHQFDALNKFTDSYIRNRLEWLYLNAVVQPKKTSRHSDTPPTSVSPASSALPPSLACNFTLVSCDGHKVPCHDWVLHARWPYFRDLVDSGASEFATDRKLVFPKATFHRKTLQGFVQYLYTNTMDGFVGDDELLEVLSVAQMFKIASLDSPPVPLPGFDYLLMGCRNTFDQLCTLQNCVDKYMLSLEYGTERHQLRIEMFIHEHFHTLLKDYKLSPKLLALGATTLGKIWVRAHGGPRDIPA